MMFVCERCEASNLSKSPNLLPKSRRLGLLVDKSHKPCPSVTWQATLLPGGYFAFFCLNCAGSRGARQLGQKLDY